MSVRDSYCTPRWITKRLPIVDLDPCSNPRSTVRAKRSLMLERGENGLDVSWRELSLFINWPFSDPLPFAKKLVEARSYCVLSNIDPSTRWWKEATQWECYQGDFHDRIEFDPPPGIERSKNDQPQCLICDPEFYELIREPFKPYVQWWRKL